jgi:uncharacterized membrane protein YjgN (DUF898 family)
VSDVSDLEGDVDGPPKEMRYSPTAVLVLALLGVTCCGVLAPAAWIMGNNYMSECEALGVLPDNRGSVGRIIGIAATLVWGALLFLRVLLCLLGGG